MTPIKMNTFFPASSKLSREGSDVNLNDIYVETKAAFLRMFFRHNVNLILIGSTMFGATFNLVTRNQ